MAYICTVFFMVLDLRLIKVGCRDDNQFFFCPYVSYHPDVSSDKYIRISRRITNL